MYSELDNNRLCSSRKTTNFTMFKKEKTASLVYIRRSIQLFANFPSANTDNSKSKHFSISRRDAYSQYKRIYKYMYRHAHTQHLSMMYSLSFNNVRPIKYVFSCYRVFKTLVYYEIREIMQQQFPKSLSCLGSFEFSAFSS